MAHSAVLFDFNGTLFWDSEYQENSWIEYLDIHQISLTREEIDTYIHGRNAKDTFEYIFKREFSREEIHQLVEEKEVLYRKECLKNGMELAPGALDFFRYLKERGMPMAIATASGRTNVRFFIEQFDLLEYFREEHIIYDDGFVRGKPHPDLFLKAIDALSVRPEGVTIFEDSVSGIEAAKRSNVKNVVLIDPFGRNNDSTVIGTADFRSFDRNLL